MYFVSTIHPELPETQVDGYLGEWLTLQDKRDAITEFHATNKKPGIPIVVNHDVEKTYGSLVPVSKRVGKVKDLFMDKDGDLVAKCVLYTGTEAFKQISQGIHLNREKWGVSVRIDWCMPDGLESKRIDKRLTHVALTQTPYLGEQGAYIHHWSHNSVNIDRVIDREYFTENEGHCFASDQLKSLIKKATAGI